MVNVDRNKMSQVIHNLVSNAIKFTPPGGQVTVIATMEADLLPLLTEQMNGEDVGTYRLNGDALNNSVRCVKVTVTDTGAGLTQVRAVCGAGKE